MSSIAEQQGWKPSPEYDWSEDWTITPVEMQVEQLYESGLTGTKIILGTLYVNKQSGRQLFQQERTDVKIPINEIEKAMEVINAAANKGEDNE
jgi:hypothetical protein